jgi:hypothetical protein
MFTLGGPPGGGGGNGEFHSETGVPARSAAAKEATRASFQASGQIFGLFIAARIDLIRITPEGGEGEYGWIGELSLT